MVEILNLKGIISLKIRSRCDSWTDQWNRILMSKMYLITALIIGLDYFQDEISCIIPENAAIDPRFVQSACWITGFYVYPELTQWKHVGYYGVPKDLSLDGVERDGSLCATTTKYGEKNYACKAFKKEFYLQYQWYPFFVGSLGILYYLPYLVFRFANKDINSLRKLLKEGRQTKEGILASYFDKHMNPRLEMRTRLFGVFLVKFVYLAVNFFSFHFINFSLNGRFVDYGISWLDWNRLPNHRAHDFITRGFPKPGNELLPTIGICDINESSRDVRNTLMNRHKFICEISQNVLYQYCFLVIWYLIIISMCISFYGIAYQVSICCKGLLVIRDRRGPIYRCNEITLREHQYLEVIKDTDLAMYQLVSTELSQDSNLNNTNSYNKMQKV